MKQFDLAKFTAFVAGKPAGEEYVGMNPDKCALAQFGLPGIRSRDARRAGIPYSVYAAAFSSKTFGQLATRLAALQSAKVQP